MLMLVVIISVNNVSRRFRDFIARGFRLVIERSHLTLMSSEWSCLLLLCFRLPTFTALVLASLASLQASNMSMRKHQSWEGGQTQGGTRNADLKKAREQREYLRKQTNNVIRCQRSIRRYVLPSWCTQQWIPACVYSISIFDRLSATGGWKRIEQWQLYDQIFRKRLEI